MSEYLNKILDDKTNIVGEIYIITNIIDNKNYIGQTLTHRKNHNKYRPFGFKARFKEHISEALCNTKKKQCTYLNNAIRKNGSTNFKVELLIRCSIESLDNFEKIYIDKYNSIYPNGYNLTVGGSTFKNIITEIKDEKVEYTKKSKTNKKSDETKTLISNRLKEIFGNNDELKKKRMNDALNQHSKKKMELFKNIKINKDDIEKYLKLCNSKKNGQYYEVIVENKKVSFISKYQKIEDLKQRAINFLENFI